MAIINDLGVCAITTKSKTPRHYYEVSCDCCGALTVQRQDQIRDLCAACTKDRVHQQQVAAALEILDKGEKECSICKQTKPLAAFGAKTAILSGFRSCCKDCRYELEKETNAKYVASIRGKLLSATRLGKRRERIYTTANNTITPEELSELKAKQNNCCHYCGTTLNDSSPRQVHLDHIIPLSKGGTHTIDNVVWSCAYCNLTKSNNIN